MKITKKWKNKLKKKTIKQKIKFADTDSQLPEKSICKK